MGETNTIWVMRGGEVVEYEVLEERVNMAPLGTAKLGLDNMRTLMHHLGDPQEKLKLIHIAGTNGKGSTAMMTATVLEKAGYKVGLFTSPSLVDFNERIQINRQPISDADLEEILEVVNEKLPADFFATQFEMFTALAWLAFDRAQVDIVVMEVGLGGRLDATNIISQPLLSVITKIALDHVHILGDTLAAIAQDKAGIIKAGTPVISYPQAPEAGQVLETVASARKVPLTVVDLDQVDYQLDNSSHQSFSYRGYDYQLSLLEDHQIFNACLVIEIVTALRNNGWEISQSALQEGLSTAKWPARFELIRRQGLDLIIDGSHNVDGIKSLRNNLLRYYPNAYRIGVIGMVADKDIAHVLENIVPVFDELIVTQPDTHRALATDDLMTQIKASQLIAEDKLHACPDFWQTPDLAKNLANKEDQDAMVCFFGSFYYVGELRQALLD
ncbi:bifunctional folylpolyglutamate synthase/dihydrofolate synthase [Aerococcus kribbianus]|uniref:tetrahydrofolate synthase n=1 Tax=Aerococcus kribbianus TaxID=2999064 RepID=A0A9X3JGY6_9LACT|nr:MULTISPECIES: folylpolyglutamate synthase/dihydrofolate synthase family protein [unclassified Aerococcus]MCZ0717771.1 bifunctional folylpolyglutamate synthase/dihydrofolate synthase [Aerococcus sp. YH-aer221]MCZ0726059.1 bifunctional folylpolyglutamate synthase/dihydrofolate synthase [Aerococcus sp. YH-aer222]